MRNRRKLWFAWKYLPLWYQQQPSFISLQLLYRCDLLENIYLCGINNNAVTAFTLTLSVVICLKISTFVVSTTTRLPAINSWRVLWFAWKYLPLWYQQQRNISNIAHITRCDLLENIYLCGINNNEIVKRSVRLHVVICLKISTFVVSTTTMGLFSQYHHMLWFAWKYLPLWYQQQLATFEAFKIDSCDLLENIYLCGINNNWAP